MYGEPVLTILLCVVTALISIAAFHDSSLLERMMFRPEAILARKEWHRLFSSALIHLDWMHLAFNLFALYSFGGPVENIFGSHILALIYGASILGGSLLSLYLHRNHDYSALGASGGVCGVIFAVIFLVPGTGVGMLFLPFSVPGPVFAVAYLVVTFLALRRGVGNIGHDAHFGGAFVGLVLAAIIKPDNCLRAPVFFAACLVFCLCCLFILWRDPLGIGGSIMGYGRSDYRSNLRYQRYDESRARSLERAEVDRLLDRISAEGMDSLSDRERRFLSEYSARNRKS